LRLACGLFVVFIPPKKNLGGPGSSRGTLERIRVGLTIYVTGWPAVDQLSLIQPTLKKKHL
jgi:hypothetical protein